jgi:hypothetical protein
VLGSNIRTSPITRFEVATLLDADRSVGTGRQGVAVAGKQPGGRVLRDENFLCGKESVHSQTHNKRNLTLFITVAR